MSRKSNEQFKLIMMINTLNIGNCSWQESSQEAGGVKNTFQKMWTAFCFHSCLNTLQRLGQKPGLRVT